MSVPKDAMAPASPAGSASDKDYEALLSVLSESACGRAFLAEHARRARHADTTVLLGVIERLEALIRAQGSQTVVPVTPESAPVPAQTGIRDDGAEVSQSRPASDPLAALKALSDDERLALFT